MFDNVAFTLHVTGAKGKEIKKRVLRSLAGVGLSHQRNKMPHELSGGEQQRVAVARALINNPLFLLADEPTGNLDPDTSHEILELLKNINTRGTAVVMATHNYNLVRKMHERISAAARWQACGNPEAHGIACEVPISLFQHKAPLWRGVVIKRGIVRRAYTTASL